MGAYESSVEINAGVDAVWAVLRAVESWPEWTSSMSEVEALTGPLRVGAEFRVRQPRISSAVWTVVEVTEGRSFAWTSQAAGVQSRGDHSVTPTAGATVVSLRFSQTGPMAWVGTLFYGRLIARYLAAETAGLKSRVEGPAASTPSP